MARAADVVILGYQMLVRPLFPAACRFVPSCSEYGRLAVRSSGVTRGLWLTARRVLRCHPFHPGGYDPPPAANV
ncbi:MAG TPA: membrane protein insertion efficiency factor YidD [Candidatus Binatia bacterium]|nr:membrane protein insertion efficiency factor YidD [Candidatus Binatia bacterium]